MPQFISIFTNGLSIRIRKFMQLTLKQNTTHTHSFYLIFQEYSSHICICLTRYRENCKKICRNRQHTFPTISSNFPNFLRSVDENCLLPEPSIGSRKVEAVCVKLYITFIRRDISFLLTTKLWPVRILHMYSQNVEFPFSNQHYQNGKVVGKSQSILEEIVNRQKIRK